MLSISDIMFNNDNICINDDNNNDVNYDNDNDDLSNVMNFILQTQANELLNNDIDMNLHHVFDNDDNVEYKEDNNVNDFIKSINEQRYNHLIKIIDSNHKTMMKRFDESFKYKNDEKQLIINTINDTKSMMSSITELVESMKVLTDNNVNKSKTNNNINNAKINNDIYTDSNNDTINITFLTNDHIVHPNNTSISKKNNKKANNNKINKKYQLLINKIKNGEINTFNFYSTIFNNDDDNINMNTRHIIYILKSLIRKEPYALSNNYYCDINDNNGNKKYRDLLLKYIKELTSSNIIINYNKQRGCYVIYEKRYHKR